MYFDLLVEADGWQHKHGALKKVDGIGRRESKLGLSYDLFEMISNRRHVKVRRQRDVLERYGFAIEPTDGVQRGGNHPLA